MPEEVQEVEQVEKAEEVKAPEAGTPEAEEQAVAELQALMDERNGVKKPEAKKEEESGEVEAANKAKDDKKEKPSADAAPSPVIPANLIYRAAKVMEEAELAEYEGDPKGLERAVSLLERRQKDSSTQSKPAGKAEDVEVDEEIPDYDEDTVAEPIAKANKVIKGKLTKAENALKALRKEMAELKKETSEYREQNSFQADAMKFDRGIASLGHPDLFGDGDIDDLDADSEQAANRVKLLKVYLQTRAVCAQTGEKLGKKELMKRALSNAFPDAIAKKNNEEIAKKLKTSGSRISLEPRNRKASDQATADEKVLAEFEAILSKK